MKNTQTNLVVLVAFMLSSMLDVRAQNTAFSYQGRLSGGGNPANGNFDLRFVVFDASSAGGQVGSTLTNTAITVSKGLFMTTLDFGPDVFTGAPRWLEIGVRTNGGGEFRTLPTRQIVSSEPYSLFAARAGEVNWTNVTSVPGGFADGVDDVANYTAGAGLAITGSVISVKFGTNGVVNSVARSDHEHLGQSWFNWANLAGIPPGFLDGVDDNTTYSAGAGLSLAGTTFGVDFGGNGAANTAARSDHSHIYSWTNLVNIPGGFADGIDNGTNYTAGNGLTLTGNMFSVSFGTNGAATTAARSDHNHHGQSWSSTNFDGLLVTSTATNGTGVHGIANNGFQSYGVFGESFIGFGLVGSGGSYGVYGYSSNGYAMFAQSSGGFSYPQLALFQDNGSDSCRLRMGTAGAPQWQIAVSPGATPQMNFHNGSTNVMFVDFAGNLAAKSFNPSSDRSIKQDFAKVDVQEVLTRVAELPIQTWRFKDDSDTRHIGPTAQDFHAAFNVGPDDKHIATVDADGVALAAIQALDQTVKEKQAKIESLEKRLRLLEQIVASLAERH